MGITGDLSEINALQTITQLNLSVTDVFRKKYFTLCCQTAKPCEITVAFNVLNKFEKTRHEKKSASIFILGYLYLLQTITEHRSRIV